MKIDIPFYDLVNKCLFGLIFLGLFILVNPSLCFGYISNELIGSISTGSEIIITLCVFAISYEIGLIINRIGSVVLEPLFKKIHLIPFDNDYKKFNKVKKEYPIMETLSREYALSRTSIVLFLVLTAISILGENKLFGVPFILIAIIFYFSYKKFATKIVNMMKETRENDN